MAAETYALWKLLVLGIGLSCIILGVVFRIYIQPTPEYLVGVRQYSKSIPLLLFRVAVLGFFVAVWVLEISTTDWFDLVYYTWWNFSLQIVYFTLAIVDQAKHWHQARCYANHALNTLFDVCFTSCFLVALVYWILLFNPSNHLEWFVYVVHLVNVFVLLLDFGANDHVVQRTSLKYVVLWPTLYSILTWIGNSSYLDGFWPYNLMDLSKSLAPLIWFGIILAHVGCFGGVLLLSKLKLRCVGVPPPPPSDAVASPHVQNDLPHLEIVTPHVQDDLPHLEIVTPHIEKDPPRPKPATT
ncbi:Aste57867_20103 [Aphanomyces stellatus]|uniref:Aste57867_20103 protein n=1 Tax=Aphanomyces stellatus TaxID=120398 RepID=A0A485LG52_9STRA|nr:hypothetical protein As57867_020037 [Aphanomyces stellatus]VFT96798.1 Aste57867_20103 [Aphanomyces stellatus]